MSAPSLRRMLVTSGVKLWTSEREKIHFIGNATVLKGC